MDGGDVSKKGGVDRDVGVLDPPILGKISTVTLQAV